MHVAREGQKLLEAQGFSSNGRWEVQCGQRCFYLPDIIPLIPERISEGLAPVSKGGSDEGGEWLVLLEPAAFQLMCPQQNHG